MRRRGNTSTLRDYMKQIDEGKSIKDQVILDEAIHVIEITIADLINKALEINPDSADIALCESAAKAATVNQPGKITEIIKEHIFKHCLKIRDHDDNFFINLALDDAEDLVKSVGATLKSMYADLSQDERQAAWACLDDINYAVCMYKFSDVRDPYYKRKK